MGQCFESAARANLKEGLRQKQYVGELKRTYILLCCILQNVLAVRLVVSEISHPGM